MRPPEPSHRIDLFAADRPRLSRPRAGQLPALPAALLAGLLALAPATLAQDDPNAIEVGIGVTYSSEEDFDLDLTSLRYSRHLAGEDGLGKWFAEVHVIGDPTDVDRDDAYIDLSLRRTLKQWSQGSFFAVGGAGAWLYDDLRFVGRDDFGFPVFEDAGTETVATVHLGFGFAWDFHDRAYLRADFLRRETIDPPSPDFFGLNEDDFTNSLTLGWRF